MTPAHPTFRRLLACLGLFLSLTAAAFAADHTSKEGSKSFDIPAGPADQALKQLSIQGGVEVIFSSNLTRGVKANAVKGDYTPKDAMDHMLADTGLVVAQDAKTGALTVRKETPAEAKNDSSRPEGSDRAADGSKVEGGVIKLETFEVMGSKLLNMDKPRTRDDAQPYVVFDRQKIEQSGVSNLELFLKQRLTMNTASRLSSETASITSQNTQVNLRGLGANQTLILIDGRRAPDASIQGRFSQPDIGAIPMGAIERIEILPTTASAIYGGGATGGAINIILRRNYVGAEVRLTYDNTFQTDSAIRRVELNSGFVLEGGKTNVMFSASASDANDLLVQDRDFTQRQRALFVANRGYLGYNTASGLLLLGVANTTNIKSANGTNLVLKNGTPLNSPITFVAPGYAGPATDGGAAFVANAGKLNLDLSNDASPSGGQAPFYPTPAAIAFSATLRRQFTPSLEVFLEGSYSRRQTAYSGPVVQLNTFAASSLPAAAASNPFQQPIVFFGPVPNAPQDTYKSITVTSRAAGGIIAKLPHEWIAEADFTIGETLFSEKTSGISFYNSDALSADVQSGAVNFLRDTNVYPIDLSRYLDPTQPGFNTLRPYTTDLADASLRASGPVVRLPAGPLRAMALLEHRKQWFDDVYEQSDESTVTFFPARDQSIDSAFVELSAPMVSKEMKIPAMQNLELQLSVRRDVYTTHAPTGSVSNPTSSTVIFHKTNKVHSTDPLFALLYQPTADATFRASYGTGFLPPAVNQLVPSVRNNTTSTTFTDSRRGNTTTTLIATPANDTFPGGGNPNLKPERSKSWSAGLIFTPRAFSGLRLSVDYTRIEKTDNITSPPFSSSDIAVLEQAFPSRVVRGPNLPGDQPGWAGPVTFLDLTLVNLARTKVAAYDVQLDYDLKTRSMGAFDFFMVATRQDHLVQQATQQAKPVENVGTTSALRYKANGGATWRRAKWTMGWNFEYYDSFWLAAAHTVDLNQGSARIGSQIYHDLFVALASGRHTLRSDWRAWFLNDIEVTLGVHNVFNHEPPIRATTAPTAPFGDPRLATYWLSIKRSFD